MPCSSPQPIPGRRKTAGRPSKKTPQIVNALLKAIATGAPYTICCAAVGVHIDTFMQWKKTDRAFADRVEQVAAQSALRLLNKIKEHGEKEFQALCWLLERRFPESFSRPEVQLSLTMQNNVTQNYLSISITGEQAREIEAETAPIRERVAQMISRYRPALGNGNGAGEAAEPIPAEGAKVPVIVRKDGDEHKPEFWNQFASGDPGRLVERKTAVYVVRTIILETIGAHRCGKIEFEGEVTIADCLAMIDKLVGVGNPGGWQRLLAKAGVRPGPGA